MKGRKCKCGFATLATKTRCPRCGKVTSDAEWKDAGTVHSFAKLGAVPDGFKVPMAIALVEVEDNGPKITCWSEEEHAVGDRVALTDSGGNSYVCERKSQPSP